MTGGDKPHSTGRQDWPKPRIVSLDDVPFLTQVLSYLNFLIAMVASHIRDAIRRYRRWDRRRDRERRNVKTVHDGYPQILSDFSTFFERELYGRIKDCWYRPICSNPGPWIDVLLRSGHPLLDSLTISGDSRRCLNMASYNYLGFSETKSQCTDAVEEALRTYGTGACSVRSELGSLEVHRKLEEQVARFLGKEDAIIFAMGYATNTTNLPSLVGKGGLIVSDSLNHASIVVGCRASGASIKIFKHNDPSDLEKVIRAAIISGQPRTHRPWKKILIVVEGIYSMEGEICNLPQFIEIKKKYKCYLYVDEAHSIGALGRSGRGVKEYFGVHSDDVDIFMGTLTKSFASVGGYIAGSKDLIDYLRVTSFSSNYDHPMAASCTQQSLSALRVISGEDGTDEGRLRLEKLAKNTRYMRRRLEKMGFDVIGSPDSPVIPIMIYQPTKMPAFSRLALQERIAVVVASYPVTELMLSRVRLCCSSSHSKADLDYALNIMSHIGDVCLLKYNLRHHKIHHPVPRSIEAPKHFWEDVKSMAEREWSWAEALQEEDYDEAAN